MPDGVTNVYPFITDWRPEDLPFPVWLAPFNGGKSFGDMLWTGGISLKIASARFIEALKAAEVTGYQIFDVDLRDHTSSPVDGYMGFATDPFPESDIQNPYDQDFQSFAFIAKQRVVEALRQYGADKLDIQSYDLS